MARMPNTEQPMMSPRRCPPADAPAPAVRAPVGAAPVVAPERPPTTRLPERLGAATPLASEAERDGAAVAPLTATVVAAAAPASALVVSFS